MNAKEHRLNLFAPILSILLAISHTAEGSPQNCAAAASSAIAKLPVKARSDGSVPWYAKISFTKTERLLRTAKINEMKDLLQAEKEIGKKASGTTEGMKKITFEDGTKAVWKPGKWQQPYAEVGAYQLSRLVGSRLVPPTVIREINSVVGSMQYYVDTSFDLKQMTEQQRNDLWTQVPIWQKAQRDIFNFVFGNWDLHRGNVLIDDSHSIVSIDNGVIKSRQQVRWGERPFLLKIGFSRQAREKYKNYPQTPFPFDQATTLPNPTKEQFAIFIHDYNSDPETVERFWRWIENDKDRTMDVVFWQGGIWIRSKNHANYGPIQPSKFPEKLLQSYAALTFVGLRQILAPEAFSDVVIEEMLQRRDLMLRAAGWK